MGEIHVAWKKGLIKDREAMRILSQSPLISHIEGSLSLQDIAEIAQMPNIEAAIHNPERQLRLGIEYPQNFISLLFSNGADLAISQSESKVIGVHLGTLAENPSVLSHFAQGRECALQITNIDSIVETAVHNLVELEYRINHGNEKKYVLFEQTPFRPYVGDPPVENLSLEELNAYYNFLTSPEIVAKIQNHPKIIANPFIGYLLDISHATLAAINQKFGRVAKFTSREAPLGEARIKHLIRSIGDKIYFVHLNSLDTQNGYLDDDHQLLASDLYSEYALQMMGLVDGCNNLLGYNLEMEPRNLTPLEYAIKISAAASRVEAFIN